MNCKYCKMEVPEGYRYCPNCGLLLDLGSVFTAPKRNYQIPKYEYKPKHKTADAQNYLQPQREESSAEAEERLDLELRKATEREARAALEQDKQPTEAVEFSDEEFAQVEQDSAPDAIELAEETKTAPEESEASSGAEENGNAVLEEMTEEKLAEASEAVEGSDAVEAAETVEESATEQATDMPEENAVVPEAVMTEEMQIDPEEEIPEAAEEGELTAEAGVSAAEKVDMPADVLEAAENPVEPDLSEVVKVSSDTETTAEAAVYNETETDKGAESDAGAGTFTEETAIQDETALEQLVPESAAEDLDLMEAEEVSMQVEASVQNEEALPEAEETETAAEAEQNSLPLEHVEEHLTIEAALTEKPAEAGEISAQAEEVPAQSEAIEEGQSAPEETSVEPAEESSEEMQNDSENEITVSEEKTKVIAENAMPEASAEVVDAAPEVAFPDDGLDPEKVNKFGNPAFTWDENISFMEAVSEKSVGDFALEIEEEEAEAEAKAAEIRVVQKTAGNVTLAAKPLYEGSYTEETSEAAAGEEQLTEETADVNPAAAPEDISPVESASKTAGVMKADEGSDAENDTEAERTEPTEPEEKDAVPEAAASAEAEKTESAEAEKPKPTETEKEEAAEAPAEVAVVTEKAAEEDMEAASAEESTEADAAENEMAAEENEEAEPTAGDEMNTAGRPKLRLWEDEENFTAEETSDKALMPEKKPSKKHFLIPLAICAVAAGAIVVYLNLPAQRISRALRKGQKYVAENNFSAAVPVLKKVLKDKPEQVEVYLLLSEAYANTDQHAAAVSLLEEAKAAFPDNAELLERLAELNPTVTISLSSGTYSDPQSISLSSEKGQGIRYTLTDENGTGSEQEYDDEILLSTNGSFTLKAYALASDGAAGETVEAQYTISLDPEKYSLDQFVTTEAGTQYIDADGAVHVGWLTKDDRSYYFDAEGYMLTGLQTIDNSSYFFGEDGAMATGWQEQGGKRYFFDDQGQMLTDCWVDNLYYVGADGAMLTDTTTPDGTYVNAQGRKGFDAASEFANYPNSIVQVHVSSKVDKGDYYEVKASVYHQKSDNKPTGDSYDISLKVSKKAVVHYLDNNLPDIIASDAFSFLKEIGLQKIKQDDDGIVTEFSFALGEKRS